MLLKNDSDTYSYKSLCSSCTTPCCTEAMSPIVFPEELIKIRNSVNKPIDDFTDEIILSGKTFHILKEKKDSTECVFLDSDTKLCTIYENRPFDCRLFPFDINKIDGKFMWVLFTCNGQKESDWSWTKKNLLNFESDEGFPYIMDNLENFGNNKTIHRHPSNKILTKTPFVVLREIRIPSKIICRDSITKKV